LNEAIRLDPKNAVAYANRGEAYSDKGDYDRAIEDLNEAIRLAPNHAAAYANRGEAYSNKGDRERAIEDLNYAIRLEPNLTHAYVQRGLDYETQGDMDLARADFGTALTRPSGKYLTTQALRDLDTAREHLRELEQAQAPGPPTERRLVERGPRVALLIGNAAYPDAEAPLNGPTNDVRALGDELRRQGFDVDAEENLSEEAMQQALDRFYGKIKSGSTAVIFFSGFGIQSDRQSYIIPVDARIWSEVDVRRDGFSREGILTEMKGRGARVKIAMLDASRRNPYERRFRSFSAGLAAVTAPAGTLVMSSASPGSLVSDGTPAVFMAELLEELTPIMHCRLADMA
jgi:hypothetical protein